MPVLSAVIASVPNHQRDQMRSGNHDFGLMFCSVKIMRIHRSQISQIAFDRFGASYRRQNRVRSEPETKNCCG
jgi:hypothetical protein